MKENKKRDNNCMEEAREEMELQGLIEEGKREQEKKKKNKKKKVEEIQVKVETHSAPQHKIAPLVGYFPSGFDPLRGTTIRGEGVEPPAPQHSVRVFRSVQRSNRLQLVVSPNNGSKVDFVGTNYSGEAAAPQVCTYALGVLDKATQTLKIVPIACNKIFRLEPRVVVSDLPDNGPSDVMKEEITAEKKVDDESPDVMENADKKTDKLREEAKKKADKMRDLTLMYSTKKNIRQAKKRESLRKQDDPQAQEELDRKIEDMKIDPEALKVAGNITNARNIPHHDMSATTPEMAYPLDKIIFSGEWDYLLDILELRQVGEELAYDIFPSFVCNRVYKLDHIKNEEEKKRFACIFSYITHLIKFKDKHSAGGLSSTKNRKIPTILFQKFSAMFADSASKWLSDDKRDLLISYILVLTLFADNFRTDPSDIASDLRMNAVTLRKYFEHLGCKLVREGRILLATLPVPLQFPMPRRKRQRR